MAWVYIMQGSTGRHYIGSTVDLDQQLKQHRRRHTHTTRRLGELTLAAAKEVGTLSESASESPAWTEVCRNLLQGLASPLLLQPSSI